MEKAGEVPAFFLRIALKNKLECFFRKKVKEKVPLWTQLEVNPIKGKRKAP